MGLWIAHRAWRPQASFIHQSRKGTTMNKDQIKGRAERAKGKVKEAAADLRGDARLESRAKTEQVKGKARADLGDAKEKVKRAIDKT